ncbi:MAG: peptide ABC transporter permease [Clostridiales bacterium]|nr:MAG: peptide ABC transporter permease [Clostridiales bacterium]
MIKNIKSKQVKFGMSIILFFTIIAIFAPLIAPYNPSIMGDLYQPPSLMHPLGTNDVGYDILSELIYGTRVSLFIGFFTAFIVTIIGTLLALISGYYKGIADKIITAITSIAMAIPGLPLTVLLVAFLEPSKWNIIIAISITAWTGTARILRAKVLQISEQPYIKIEKTLGVKNRIIILKHILPNIKDIVLIRAAMAISSAMLTEAGLSFLGLGAFGEKSWGSILRYAIYRNAILKQQYWWYLPPIICITLAVLGFMLVGYYGGEKNVT